jgi:hypothetical protein
MWFEGYIRTHGDYYEKNTFFYIFAKFELDIY